MHSVKCSFFLEEIFDFSIGASGIVSSIGDARGENSNAVGRGISQVFG